MAHQQHLREHVELRVDIADLVNLDYLSKSDPFFTIHIVRTPF